MLNNIDAIIFDMDGTLVDSMWIWKEIDRFFFDSHQIESPPNLEQIIEGMSSLETAQYFINTFHLNQSAIDLRQMWNIQAMDYYAHEITYKYGVKRLLHYCKKHQIKLGIATSNSPQLVQAAAQNLGFDFYFDSIITSCQVNIGKPAPDVYLAVAKELNVVPKRCLIFEDVPMGIKAGHNAGMKTCAIYDMHNSQQEELKKHMADYYINNYHELFKGDL